ncbi:helix-turn-helix transcriptional regulator [Nitratireductor aquimarinus]|uniref:helix-turn-helix domain-containing protein n=1 Tax=Nitratireductor aquimarinus TaxID=889300 RepID=UPI0029354F7D|nr:helix-turn-helix transcriptional regulator [Nitratireductor aquimarinus]MDV2964576.1 helix-turn-helix transcriptional regulator [Nitratireductor aquimarinus]
MPKKTRFHIDSKTESEYTPKHLTKQEFGRRLYKFIMAKGWNQSELARQSGLPRDSISTYVRGQSLPTPKSLQKLAQALGVEPVDILPNSIESAIDEDNPSLEMRVSTASPSKAWLRVNRLVSLSTAARVIDIIESDASSEKSDEAADAV